MALTIGDTADNPETFITRKEAWDRFILIVKPEQSGKTAIMTREINETLLQELLVCKNLINKFLEEDSGKDRKTVNFIFCDNSLLLTEQTKNRINKEIHLPGIEEPHIQLSSDTKGSAKNNWSEVYFAILDGTRNVICCTNGKRISDIHEIIVRLNKHHSGCYNFKIWLDEADKFINNIDRTFIPLVQENENVGVYMITATSQPIFKKYKEVRTMALENTTLPTYHGWDDCDIIIKEDESGGRTIPFARQIADEMLMKGELFPGVKGYVPADTKKKSHKDMRDMFVAKGVAVFTVNGEGLELALPHDPNSASLEPPTPIKIKKTKELHVHIRELYTYYNVCLWPCVVTGNICVGRGISIQQPDFMFNFAILSNCTNKADASQNAGRLKGNFKEWPGYTPPKVYTTEKFNRIASEYECQSREIAKIAFKKVNETGAEEGTALVTNVEVKTVVKGPSAKRALLFDTFEEVKGFTNAYFGNASKPRSLVPKELRKDHPDRNPTARALKDRLWGINKKKTFRLYPTEDQKFCIYWNSELVGNDVENAYKMMRNNHV